MNTSPLQPSSPHLTEEQKQRIYNEKAKHFMEGMKKLTQETGLALIPTINYTERANELIFQLVEAPKQVTNQPNEKTV